MLLGGQADRLGENKIDISKRKLNLKQEGQIEGVS